MYTAVFKGGFSEIPQELLENILDFFPDDKATLGKCSLTCRNWTYPAQRHLHHHVEVSFLCRWHYRGLPPHLNTRYTLPRVARMVRSLAIRRESCRDLYCDNDEFPLRYYWVEVERLTNVQSLTLNSWVCKLTDVQEQRLVSQFLNITNLSLIHCTFWHTTLPSLLSGFPHLVRLHVDRFDMFSSDAEEDDVVNSEIPPLSPNAGSQLRHIVLEEPGRYQTGLPHIIRCLSAMSDNHSRGIQLEVVEMRDDGHGLAVIMDALGSSLIALRLEHLSPG